LARIFGNIFASLHLKVESAGHLLRRYAHTGEKNALSMAENTLRQMRLGGISVMEPLLTLLAL